MLHYVETCLQKKWMNNGQSPVIHSFVLFNFIYTVLHFARMLNHKVNLWIFPVSV